MTIASGCVSWLLPIHFLLLFRDEPKSHIGAQGGGDLWGPISKCTFTFVARVWVSHSCYVFFSEDNII